ncbi:MAG TPA: 50S ribosomal protein L25 [Phycisphaerae bacterium]|nr:50S ribosomal protein L25 [Phycisphaerae bacterium]
MAAVLKATRRTQIGSRGAKKIRQTGSIPGIVYGHGQDPIPITLSEHEMELAIQHGERVLELDLDGQTENVLIKEVQYDTFGHEVLHVDLARVSLDERVEVTVQVILRGTPAGAADGGVLNQVTSDIEIECLVTSIPEEIVVPVGAMKVDDMLHLKDIPLPEGATLLSDPEAVLCTVTVVAEEEVAAEAVEGEEAAEPEVIGEKKEEAEEGAEEGEKK